MNFQIIALPAGAIAAGSLAEHVIADAKPGYPCRVSLADAEPGEELLLLHYEHHAVATPYRASHAIYVRRGAVQAHPAVNEIPAMFHTRTLSLRGFTAAGRLEAADQTPGSGLAAALNTLLEQESIAYVHIHNAKTGCYFAQATRAAGG